MQKQMQAGAQVKKNNEKTSPHFTMNPPPAPKSFISLGPSASDISDHNIQVQPIVSAVR